MPAPQTRGETVTPVLVVDDSVVARAVMTRLIDASGRFAVVGAVGTVAAALAFLASNTVALILLDIAMPGVDGLTGLPDLLAAGRGAQVVVVSSSAHDGAAASVQALALGAADTLEKPGTSGLSTQFGRTLVERLDRLIDPAAVPVVRELPAPVARVVPTTGIGDDFDMVAIGASTGGIHALAQLLRALPANFTTPIVITQHLPASFMPYFAAQVAVFASRPCDVATDRLRIKAGRIVVAPGDAHLRCVALGERQAGVRLSVDPSASGCLPSVDPMFASLSAIFAERLLAVVLTGMGRDGAEGARTVRSGGGTVVAQDRASSVVWGMPGTVVARGLADAVMPPEEIGRLIATGRRP